MPNVPKAPASAEGGKTFRGDQPPADGPDARYPSEPGVSNKAYDVDVRTIGPDRFKVENVPTSNAGFDGPLPAA